MSLFDYLNSDSTTSTSASSSVASQISLLLQQPQAKQTTAASTSGSSSTSSSVSITLDAVRANATATDAKKDADELAAEIRKTLDDQYDGKTGQTPAVGAFSGRALALVALNEDGSFSRTEVAAAKLELRERDRASALAFLSSGELTATSLKGYSQQLIAARETMSAEERSLRDTDPSLR